MTYSFKTATQAMTDAQLRNTLRGNDLQLSDLARVELIRRSYGTSK